MLQENSKIIISNPRKGCEFLKGKTGTITGYHHGLVNKSLIIYHIDLDENVDGLTGAGLRTEEITVYQTPVQDTLNRHGSPFDRGGADFYYGHPSKPHYYIGGTGTSPEVKEQDMTDEQVKQYYAGFNAAAEQGDQKDWG